MVSPREVEPVDERLTGRHGQAPPAPRVFAFVLAALLLATAQAVSTRGSGGADAGQTPGFYKDACTNRDLEGAFGFFGAGSVLASPVTGLAGPFGRVGRFISDGAGNLSFSSRATFNGLGFHQDFSGTYTVNRDCTFTALVTLPFSHPSIEPFTLHATFRGVISDDGKEIQDLFVNPPGVVIYGKGRKQRLSRCTAADFYGSFQFDLTGSTLDLGFPLPFSSLGRLEVDGHGNVAGHVNSNTGGLAVPADVTGGYTVATDCTFELHYCVLSQDGGSCVKNFTHHGVLVDGGDTAFLVVLEPEATTLLGQLRRQ
jgi:hypothetical protein